ncbi:MAG: AMP-binding protein, partial [Sandaracinaceae bacterium]
MTRSLRDGFIASAQRFADREALRVGSEARSYAELLAAAQRIAATLDAAAPDGEGRLTAVFGHRHPTTFEGILGALYRGHGYVPLNPAFPIDRTRAMLVRSEVSSLVVDPTAAAQLEALLDGVERPLLVLLPDAEDVDGLASRFVHHRFLGRADLAPADRAKLGETTPDAIAYLLFTSGSTGQPKGVMVAHRNVNAFIDSMVERYGITEHDRFSDTFDLTFDLSVFDLFCAWERGACVCVPTAQQKMFPGKYIKQNALTVWFSVPSTGVLMSRLKMLKPDSYPELRWALFCGEAL